MEDIKVSIICITYNHEKYIEKALEGFVMQKTSFPFEVLIHDDASTDKTADIIREYEERYPNIIKPIYQKENQYSKGCQYIKDAISPHIHGKYIAFCEGDDYWIDSMKLQKQFDALENHPELDICAHGAYIESNGKIRGKITPSNSETIFPPEEVILGGGGFVMTASLMWRAVLESNIPTFCQFLNLDYTIQIHGALRGGMLYLPDMMSVYRMSLPGSWTSRMANDVQASILYHERLEKMLLILNEDTNKKYETCIERKILNTRFDMLSVSKRYREMLSKEYQECFIALPFRSRLKVLMLAYLPWVDRLLDHIKTEQNDKSNE